jgi:hypothetical protein
MRRIDLFCKLVAPVVISLVDGLSTNVAVWTVLGVNVLCVFIEYIAIAQVSSSLFALYIALSLTRYYVRCTRRYRNSCGQLQSRQMMEVELSRMHPNIPRRTKRA